MFDKDNKFGFINNNSNNNNNNIDEMHNSHQNLKPFMTSGNFAYFNVTNLKVGTYTPYQDIPQTAWVFQVINKAGVRQTWFSSTKSRGCFIVVSSVNNTTGMVNILYLIDTLVGMEYKQLIYDTDNDIFTFNKEKRILLTNNSFEYTPTKKYHPSTKKYVDDKFICTDIIENVGIIPKEEMQKCNNGTGRYVSSIKFKEFFADYKHCVYQGMYGDKTIRMLYDEEYNRVLAYDLDNIGRYDITLGFEFNNNYMYPFSGGASEVKSYQFTNDLIITKSPVLNPSEVYMNMDNSILEIDLNTPNTEISPQSTNDLVIGENYIIMDSTTDNEYISESFSIGFSNYDNNNQYLESVLYFKTSGKNNAITITPLTNILAEDGFDWTFSGYKYHILTFKKIRDILFLTYNSYSILPT